MSGLFSSLQLGLKGLTNMGTGLAVTGENIANVNTPGYSRKVMKLKSLSPEIYSFGAIGRGADVEQISALRDRFLEKRLMEERQTAGALGGQREGIYQLETIVSIGDGNSIGDQLSAFFNSFLELAADPSSNGLREATLMQGKTLAHTLNDVARKWDRVLQNSRLQMEQDVASANEILSRLGEVSKGLAPLRTRGIDGGDLEDEQTRLIQELSGYIDIQYYTSESGQPTITTDQGALLLSGGEVAELSLRNGGSGQSILANGADITAQITSGRIGGTLQFQQDLFPRLRGQLNDIAETLASKVNEVHRQGETLDGATGTDFFTFNPSAPAATLAVAAPSTAGVAASDPGSGPGNGTIAQQIADLRDAEFSELGGFGLIRGFGQLLFDIGLESKNVEMSAETQSEIISQLETQRDSASGVSLDEEAAQLMQYQRAYEANAKLIKVVDQLLDETMDLLR